MEDEVGEKAVKGGIDTIDEVRKYQRGVHTDIVADKLRQQAGVNLKDKEGKGIGTDVRGAVAVLEKRADEEGVELRETLRLFISPDDPQTDLAKAEITQKGLLDLGDLAQIRSKVLESVALWLSDKSSDEKLRKMAEYQSEINAKAKKSLLKIAILRKATGDDPCLKPTLDLYEEFIREDLHITESEGVTLYSGKKGETYQERAERLFKGEKGEKAKRLMAAIIKPTDESLAKYSVKLETDLLRIATQVNHLRLVEMADEWIRKNSKELNLHSSSLMEIKDKITQIIAREEEGGDQRKVEEILEAISPVIRFIVDVFPHDHAYLLSHCLKKNQAICAGKEMMLGMILKDFGLDPKYTYTLVRQDNKIGRHVVTHLRLGDYLAEIDLNYSSEDFFWQSLNFRCLVNILEATGESQDRSPLLDEIRNIDDTQWIIEEGRWKKFKLVKGKRPHKISSEGELEDIDSVNLANLLWNKDYLDLAVDDDPEKRKANYQEAERLYREAIDLNPNNPSPKNNLANLLKNTEYFDLVVGDDPEKRKANYQEAERLYREAIDLNPNDPLFKNNLANLLKNTEYLDLVVGDDPEKREANYQEAESLLREAIKLDPNDPSFKNSLANLLWNKEYLDLVVGDDPEKRKANYQEAERLYREAIDLNPNNPIYDNNLNLLLNNNEYKKLMRDKTETLFGRIKRLFGRR